MDDEANKLAELASVWIGGVTEEKGEWSESAPVRASNASSNVSYASDASLDLNSSNPIEIS
jgi:hypothetical protein